MSSTRCNLSNPAVSPSAFTEKPCLTQSRITTLFVRSFKYLTCNHDIYLHRYQKYVALFFDHVYPQIMSNLVSVNHGQISRLLTMMNGRMFPLPARHVCPYHPCKNSIQIYMYVYMYFVRSV